MTSQPSLPIRAACLVLTVLCLVGFARDASAQVLWGLTDNQTLVRFSIDAPMTPIATLPVTGLAAGEKLVGIQVEYEKGNFVGVSTAGRVYLLNRRTGAATAAGPANPIAPAGTAFGMASYWTTLSLVSDAGVMGFHRDVNGNYATDGFVNGPGFVATAWTIYPTGRTFYIDAVTDTLHRRDTNDDTTTLIGSLHVDTSDVAGLDIDPHTATTYATLTVGGVGGLYWIDPNTGYATHIGPTVAPMGSIAIDFVAPIVIESPLGQPPLETNTQRTYVIRRGGDDTVAADLRLEVEQGFVSPNPATADQDFVRRFEVLHYEPGELEKTVTVTILDDAIREPTEYARIRVTENVFGGLAGGQNIEIVDDDNLRPVLRPTQPGAVLGSTVTLTGTVEDEDTVTVKLFQGFDYLPKATTTANPWTFADVPLEPGLNGILITATDPHGRETWTVVRVWRAVESEQTFAFAEGSTGAFFHTDLLFMNPSPAAVPVTMEFMREDGAVIAHSLTLPAERRVTLDVSTIPGLETAAFSTVVKTSSYPIVVERTMRWDESGYGAHTEKATTGTSQKWYFAEGAQGFMHTYLLLVNPQSAPNEVTVRFLREQDTPVTKTFTMEPRARLTVDAGSYPELVGRAFGIEVTFAQPGAAERAMYFGSAPFWSGGHESAGATAPAPEWFLAEGATGPFFKTFVLVANPGSVPAELTMRYLTEVGAPVVRTRTLDANSRLTVNLEMEDPSLQNAPIATQVTSTVPVVVERAQYWPGPPENWHEGHGSFGVTDKTQTHWALAEGRVGGPEDWQTYILMANTTDYTADVVMRFYRQDATPIVKTFTVPPNSRFTVPVVASGGLVPEVTSGSFGVDIISSIPIVVERAMYGNANRVIWAAGTSATATKLP